MISHGFIFARGGSKGLPRKNVKSLAGRPMICYSIDIAKKVDKLDRVFVSTDDDEIARIAESQGATVIERPSHLAGDSSAEWDSWRHAVEWVRDQVGDFQEMVSLPVTSPLRSVQDVEAAMFKRERLKADICISMTEASRSPYFNMVREIDGEQIKLVIDPQNRVYRRQDSPRVFDVSTVVYAMSVDFIMTHEGIFEGKVVAIEVPKERAVDIDDIYDFMLAEAILKRVDEVNA
ncbi:acylneuraminate cytidylyltransferase [Gammaproteobacteria bacterium 45_16_T64]|nr:acylneuraminate cytidylyltransferase [Gammaproteobacteria bacterium 45_16_T64]